MEMNDAARGERIRQLREARHLTGPAVVELMRDRGGPRNDGRPFISYRQYQKYEAGGGIGLDRLRVLADVLGTTGDYILRGEGDRRTPRERRSADAEPVAVDRLEGDLETRIADIEHMLAGIEERQIRLEERLVEAVTDREEILGLLTRQDRILEQIENAILREHAATRALVEAGETLAERLGATTRRVFEESALDPGTQVPGLDQRATPRNPRG